MSSRKLRVAIIGAGPGGLCMGKRLLDEGFDDFVIIEKQDDIGGTWYANQYPGCECNTPALLYSFSFETNPNWSKNYPTQPEILEYLCNIAEKYGLRKHIQLGDGVSGAKWHEETATWKLSLDSGKSIEANVVVSAMGMFATPKWPKISGLDKFKGAIWHTANWNKGHDLSKDSVAVIGSGDSAVQLIPQIVKIARQVILFQRTPNYVLPKQDLPKSPKEYKAMLAIPKLYNAARASMEQNINTFIDRSEPVYRASFSADGLGAIDVVNDTKTRQRLRPTHPFGPRRSFFSNEFYASFNKPNLTLVTETISQIKEHSIVTSDEKEQNIDTIIIATGFEDPKFLSTIVVVGQDDMHIDRAWVDGPIAYLGIMTAGFPNMFMIFGPNTYTGSVPIIIEEQVEYVIRHLNRLKNENIASVDVKKSVMIRFENEVQAAFRSIPSWKIEDAETNRLWKANNIKIWPFSIDKYRWLTAKIDPESYNSKYW